MMMHELKRTIKQSLFNIGIDVQKRNRHLDSDLVARPSLPIVLNWLFSYKGAENFRFIQIGANDGQMHDPLHQLIVKHKLKGILVEPVPEIFKALQGNYAGQCQLQFENVAVGAQEGEMPFYTLSHDLYFAENDFNFSGISSFDRNHVLRGLKMFGPRYGLKGDLESYIQKIKVPVTTLSSLMKKHNVFTLDLLQIDAEGYDFEIIKTIDFTAHKPSIIHFEHLALPAPDRTACWEFLKGHGYTNCLSGPDTMALLTP